MPVVYILTAIQLFSKTVWKESVSLKLGEPRPRVVRIGHRKSLLYNAVYIRRTPHPVIVVY